MNGRVESTASLAAAGGEDASEPGGELLYSTRSNLRAAQGDLAGALTDQLEARRLNGGQTPDPDFDGWLRIGRLLHATGDQQAAAREAEAALSWVRIWGTPGHIGQALTVSGLIIGGDEGIAQLHEAVAQLDRSPARRELARALVELGAALRRRGERKAAREPLRRALDLAAAGGLVAIAKRARAELRVTGAKLRPPNRRALTHSRRASGGSFSLRPTERATPRSRRRCS